MLCGRRYLLHDRTLPGYCALHILILSFGLYGDLPGHNNAYVFFGHTERAIGYLEQITQQPDPIFPTPQDVQHFPWLAEGDIIASFIGLTQAWWP
jgi:hypothetical protein